MARFGDPSARGTTSGADATTLESKFKSKESLVVDSSTSLCSDREIRRTSEFLALQDEQSLKTEKHLVYLADPAKTSTIVLTPLFGRERFDESGRAAALVHSFFDRTSFKTIRNRSRR